MDARTKDGTEGASELAGRAESAHCPTFDELARLLGVGLV